MPYVWSVERMAREDARQKDIKLALKAKFGEPGRLFAETELHEADDHLLDQILSTFFTFDSLDELRASIARP